MANKFVFTPPGRNSYYSEEELNRIKIEGYNLIEKIIYEKELQDFFNKKILTAEDLKIINKIMESDVVKDDSPIGILTAIVKQSYTPLWDRDAQLYVDERNFYKTTIIEYIYSEYETPSEMIDRIIREKSQ